MANQEPQKAKRALKTGEKILLVTSLIAVISLLTIGSVRNAQPHYDAQMATPEIAGKSIVRAMSSQNQTQVKALATTQGYAALQKVMKTTPLNSYPLLGNRIFTEWGNSVYWENFDDSKAQSDWGLSENVKSGEETPTVMFKRTPKGWKLDNYVPLSDKLLKRRRISVGKMWNLNE